MSYAIYAKVSGHGFLLKMQVLNEALFVDFVYFPYTFAIFFYN